MPTSEKFAGAGDSKNPPTAADPTGATGNGWSSPANVTADDGSVSTSVVMTGGNYSRYVYGYTFGHSVPAGATIDGIEVLIDRVAGALYQDYEVRLSNGVSPTYTASKTADIGAAWTTTGIATYGGPTDTWGRTWTVSEVNDTWFRASLSVIVTGLNFSQSATIDYIKTIIYYTEAGGGGGNKYEIRFGDKVIEEVRLGSDLVEEVRFGSSLIK